MKILKHILTLLLVISVTGFLAVSSFTFGQEDAVVIHKDVFHVSRSIARVVKSELGISSIEKIPYTKEEPLSLEKGSVGYLEFGKLATAFILSNQSGTVDFSAFSLSGTELTLDPMYPVVASLYDPFTTYTITSTHRDFLLTQITNGSFYIGEETNGTYSLYSIDAVIRLDFLSKGKHMADMVLFPGMYIRFDPKMNPALEGANLFRILQSLEPDGTQNETVDTTGIEFVNPRMNSTDSKDSFFMYKLPIRTNVLFQMLHVLFYDQVSQIDLYKEYGVSAFAYTNSNATRDDWLVNPGKKSHFLLLGLDTVLADALKNTVPMETFQGQIADIARDAQTLAVGNDVQLRLERFLTDGRFALFGGTRVNAQFADIYQVISETVGKAPVTAHAKLLQRLSDIYSRNLVAQKKDLAFSKIDTYSPTAFELAKTLDSTDIEQRDYFDIALYAFNVLRQAEDKSLFIDEAVYAHPTYTLIQTVLVATDRYVNSIDDPKRKEITYQGIALHFYDHILTILARSVYHTFMQEEDGYIYLKPNFRPTQNDPKIHMDDTLVRDFREIDGRLSLVSERLDTQYGADSENSVFLSIKKSIALFHSFARLLDYESYSEYIKLPYVHDDTSDIVLPIYTASGTIESSNPAEQVRLNGTVTVDPAIDTIIGLLGEIPRTDIIREGDIYRINSTVLQLPTADGASPVQTQLSLVFDKTISTFTALSIEHKDRRIMILTDKKRSTELSLVLAKLPAYITRLDDILAGNPSLEGDVRFLESSDKIVVGIYPFPLVP